MGPARWKLVSLWLSQTARVTADNALRFFVCLAYASHGADQKNSAWYLVTAIYTLPAVVLAPFNGAICNSLPKARVLTWSAFCGFAVVGLFGLLDGYWIACWTLTSLSAAIYGPTRYAMLPAAAADTRWALSRVNGFIEMGAFTAIMVGVIVIIGTDLRKDYLFADGNAAIVVVWLLNGIAWVGALPVRFPSDVQRAEPPWVAVRGFFVDGRRIWNVRDARVCLLGLSGMCGLVIGLVGATLAFVFENALTLTDIAVITCWVAAGIAVGSLAAGVQKHPRRVLGLVPLGGAGFTFGMIYGAWGGAPDAWLCAFVGASVGLVNVPLAATYQAAVPADARGNAMAVRNLTDYVFATLAGVGLFVLSRFAGFDGPMQLWVVAVIAALATAAALWCFRREVVEQIVELPFAIMYRVHAVGPGVDAIPLQGPVLVIANHSSYMDPLWLGKVVPRTIIPMMTSFFFDQWMFRWAMIYLADAIRVEASGFRRDVPELQTAVDTLDAGKCLVIFPEGRLRRSAEQPLKLFGQGVCRILEERPETPVVICWIEGGWGSFFSYFNGPPAKNKKFDIARPIGIAIGAPHRIDAAILADQRQARQYLMEQCGQMRKYLGLETVGVQETEVAETSESEA